MVARCCKSSLPLENSPLVLTLFIELKCLDCLYPYDIFPCMNKSSSLFTLSKSFKIIGLLIKMKQPVRRKDVTPACILPFADDPCEDSPCLNGGTCTTSQEEDSQFKCTCKAGFTGTRCEGTENSKTIPGQQFFPHW